MLITPKRFDDKHLNRSVDYFTDFLNHTIIYITPLTYHQGVRHKDGSLQFNIKNDKLFDMSAISVVLDLFKKFDFSKANDMIKKTYKILDKACGINTIYTVKDLTTKEFANIVFNKFDYEESRVTKKKLKDGSEIIQLIDPYTSGYGFYVNLSKPFEYCDFGYNYLHLFEHMLCFQWKKDHYQDGIVYMNGLTYNTGKCCVFNIAKNPKVFKAEFEKCAKAYFKARSKEFWVKSNKENLDIETKRTISESYTDRTLHTYFRTDPSGFSGGYDYNVLRYFASDPFKCLIITPTELSIDFSLINNLAKEYKPYTVKPKIETFETIPLETIKMKTALGIHIEKLTKKDIERALSGTRVNYSMGLNSKAVYQSFVKTTLLEAFLYHSDVIDLNDYVKKVMLPYSVEKYNSYEVTMYEKFK